MQIGRNEPCYCGSGKKYKKCCLIKKENNLDSVTEEYSIDFKPIISEEEKQEHLIEFNKVAFDASYEPTLIAISKYKVDKSLREFVLGTVENIYHMMHFKKPYIGAILLNIEDLEKVCSSKNLKLDFVGLCKEIFKLGNEYNKLLSKNFETGEKINEGERVLLTGLLEDFNTFIKMPIILKKEFIDYSLFRLHTQFVLEVLEKKLISNGNFVTFATLTIDVKNGIEYVSDFKITFEKEPLEHPPYFIMINHLKPLYNYINVLNYDCPKLSQKTIKELSKAIEDEMNIDEHNEGYISLNPAYLSWVNSLERELKEAFEITFNDKKIKKYRLEQLIDFFFESEEFNFDDEYKDSLHQVRIIRNKITHEDYEATLDELKFVRELIYESNLLQYINAIKLDY